jgi:hypothetical protein
VWRSSSRLPWRHVSEDGDGDAGVGCEPLRIGESFDERSMEPAATARADEVCWPLTQKLNLPRPPWGERQNHGGQGDALRLEDDAACGITESSSFGATPYFLTARSSTIWQSL